MSYQRELDAYSRFQKWMGEAGGLQAEFQALGLEVPAPLLRVFGIGSSGPVQIPPVTVTAPIGPGFRPVGATDDWIYIEAKQVSVAVLVSAILQTRGPIEGQLIVKEVVRIKGQGQNQTSVYNSLSTLESSGVIHRKTDKKVWEWAGDSMGRLVLVDDENGGKHFVWGDFRAFGRGDIALHRRDAILHLLRAHRSGGGLMVTQLVPLLEDSPWQKGPVSKDLIKADIEILANSGQIRRAGNSRKWTLKE